MRIQASSTFLREHLERYREKQTEGRKWNEEIIRNDAKFNSHYKYLDNEDAECIFHIN
jgi:hypothetical protein